jgi:hypothetical protein
VSWFAPKSAGERSADDLHPDAGARREDAINLIAIVGHLITGHGRGATAQKIAIARGVLDLVRRYPLPALYVAGVAIYLLSRSRPHAPARHLTRH